MTLATILLAVASIGLTEAEATKLIQAELFPKGVIEYRLADETRVDILTEDYAIEVDFAHKWAEGNGQAIYYGVMTNKIPCLVLIVKNVRAEKHLMLRAAVVAAKANVKIIYWKAPADVEDPVEPEQPVEPITGPPAVPLLDARVLQPGEAF